MRNKSVKFGIIASLLLVVFFSFSSCGNGKEEKKPAEGELVIDDDYYEFQGFNLKDYDIPAMIMLPDETADIGASTKPEVLHTEDDFKWKSLLVKTFI